MSIRFILDFNFDLRELQLQWLEDNISSDCYHTFHGIVDIMCEEDAILFRLRFGTKKHSTLIERMIATENRLEEMEKNGTRYSKHGVGPLS